MGLFDFLKRAPAPPPEALMPWVMRTSSFQLLDARWQEDGRPPLDIIPVSSDLSCVVSLSTEEGPVPARAEILAQMKLDLHAALAQALKNMVSRAQHARVVQGAILFETEDRSAPGLLLLLPALASALKLKGDPVAIAPTFNQLLVAGSDDETALQCMTDVAPLLYERSDDWLSLTAVHAVGKAPYATWTPPRGHALRSTVQSLAARSRVRQIDVEMVLAGIDEQAPRAHLAAGETGGLTAAWVRDTSVIVPADVERMVLVDTPDAEPQVLDIPFALLVETMPWIVEELGEPVRGKAPFVRMRGPLFPTPRMRAFLNLRALHDAGHPGREGRKVPVAALLAEWDAGVPVMVDAEQDGSIRLESPDRRKATAPRASVEEHIQKLPPGDHAVLLHALISAEMVKALESGSGMPAIDPALAEQVQRLSAEAARQRTPLIPTPATVDDDGEDRDPSMPNLGEPTTLYPVLRPPTYAQASRESMRGQVAHLGNLEILDGKHASFPFHGGITFDIVSDGGRTMSPLMDSNFPAAEFGAARDTAILNLRAASLEPMRAIAEGAWEGPWRDGYAASRMLVPSLFGRYEVKGPRLLFAPTVNRLWLAGGDDAAAIDAVLDAVQEYLESDEATTPYQWREMLTCLPFVVEDGAVKPWPLPDGHPCATRIRKLDEIIKDRGTSAATRAYDTARAVRAQMPAGDA